MDNLSHFIEFFKSKVEENFIFIFGPKIKLYEVSIFCILNIIELVDKLVKFKCFTLEEMASSHENLT